MKTQIKQPIIFFDGVCGMCNAFVNLMLRIDRQQKFLFAPLQGETAQAMLPPLQADARQWSIFCVIDGEVHDQSDAVLNICRELEGGWQILALLKSVPRFIRNPIYRQVARNRYYVLGKMDACRIPTEQEKARFLP